MLLDKTNTKIQGFKFTIRKKNEIVPEFDINSSLDNSNKNNDEWSHQGNNISNDINNYIIDKNVLRSTFKLTRHPFLTGRCRMTLFLKALNLYERIEPQVENKELSLKACVFLEITELVNVDIKNFLHRNGENQHISTEKEKKRR